MASIGNLALILTANSAQLEAGLSAAGRAVTKFQGLVSSTFGQIKDTLMSPLGLMGGFSAAGLLGWGVKMAGEAEQAQIAFEVMLGSAEKAKALLADITEFAAKTPFESPELISVAQSMMAFGVEGDRVMGTLRVLGDIASTTRQPLNDIALIFGKVEAAGRVTNHELRELTMRGIPIMKPLAQALGRDVTEVRKMAEEGMISARDFTRALNIMTTGPKSLQGMTQRQSTTLLGMWSTMVDNMKLTLRGVGEAAIDGLRLKQSMKLVSDYFDNLRENIKGYVQPVFEVIGGTASAVFDTMKAVFSGLWDMISPMLDKAGNGWELTWDSAREFTLNAFEKIATGALYVADVFRDVGNNIVKNFVLPIGSAIQKVVELAARALAKLAEGALLVALATGAGGNEAKALGMAAEQLGHEAGLMAEGLGLLESNTQNWGKSLLDSGLPAIQKFFNDIRNQAQANPLAPLATGAQHALDLVRDPLTKISKLYQDVAKAAGGIPETPGKLNLEMMRAQYTPLEKFQDDMSKWQKNLTDGLIDQLTFARMVGKEFNSMSEGLNKGFTSTKAIVSGTKEDYQFRISSAQKQMTPEQVLRTMLENDKRANDQNLKKLDQILQAVKATKLPIKQAVGL